MANKKDIIASYSGGEITLQEMQGEIDKIASQNDKLKDLKFDDLDYAQKETLIKAFIIKEISYDEAKKRNLDEEKEYKEALKLIESELLQKRLEVSIIKDATSEEKLKAEYQKLVEKLQNEKEIEISYISVKKESDADYIYKKIKRKPVNFSYYAKKKSLDKTTAKNGGDLGFVLKSSLPKELSDILFALKKGQISKPFLLGKEWVIAKYGEERNAEIPDFEKAKNDIKKRLAKKAIQDFVNDALDNADIKISVD